MPATTSMAEPNCRDRSALTTMPGMLRRSTLAAPCITESPIADTCTGVWGRLGCGAVVGGGSGTPTRPGAAGAGGGGPVVVGAAVVAGAAEVVAPATVVVVVVGAAVLVVATVSSGASS